MSEIIQSDLDLIVEALNMLSRSLRLRAKSRPRAGDQNATYRKCLRDRADRSAALAYMFRPQAVANRMASRAMDTIDKAVSDSIPPG